MAVKVFAALALLVAVVSGQAIETFTPRSGPQTGQTLLTVSGKAFRNTNTIKLRFTHPNDRVDIAATFINDNTIIASTSRFNTTGEHAVAITFDGISFTTLDEPFIVYGNTFPDSFVPLSGPVSGGSDLQIIGKFVNTGEIRLLFDIFNEEYVYVDAVYENEFTLRATTRRFNKPGKYDVNIALNGQQFVSFSEYYIAYDEDSIDSFSPTSGPVSGSTRVTIRGEGFSDTGEHTVQFVGNAGTVTVFADLVDSNSLAAVTQRFPAAGTYQVRVAQNGQDYEDVAGTFTAL